MLIEDLEQVVKKWFLIVVIVAIVAPILTLKYVVKVQGDLAAIENFNVTTVKHPDVTAETINAYIERTNSASRFAGYGQTFIDLGEKYHLNPSYILGRAQAETSLGTAYCVGDKRLKYNFGCVKQRSDYPSFSGYAAPETVEEGIEMGYKVIRYYIDHPADFGLTDFTSLHIEEIYSPSSDNNNNDSIRSIIAGAMKGTGQPIVNDGELTSDYIPPIGDQVISGSKRKGGSGSNKKYSCPTNCNLTEEEAVEDNSVGEAKVLGSEQLWENEDDLEKTDLGVINDNATEENLTEWLEDMGGNKKKDGMSTEDLAKAFSEAQTASGLDARFLISMWKNMTTQGESEQYRDFNNAYGWNVDKDLKFEDEKDGIVKGAKLLAKNFYNSGQKTLTEMNNSDSGHIVSSDEGWASSVAATMKTSEKFIKGSSGKIPKKEVKKRAKTSSDAKLKRTNSKCRNVSSAVRGSGGKVVGADNAEKVYNYLKGFNYTDEAIAGILGNMYQESGVNHLRLQGGSNCIGPVMATDSYMDNLRYSGQCSPGTGIVQWETPGRWDTLRAFAASIGGSPWDLEVQLKYMACEMGLDTSFEGKPGYRTETWKRKDWDSLFRNSHSYEEVTIAFEKDFERCGTCHTNQRLNYSKDFLAKIQEWN